ncbi:hypothetical protein LUX57_18725 [Actinomadura madurae]|nr:hypothetical protein [Actinomadura madurae]
MGEASEVLVPTAPMLADPLGVQRALRPLKRRVPSRHRRELDEDATAARIADTRLWTPVLVPSPERWLGLSLVVDAGPSMRLWRPLARELAETLVRQGAFQDVHVSYLDATGRVTSSPEAPPRDPRTLLDASGRQAVLVLSDCSGPHWWDGRAAHAVRSWAQAGPTAIVQPLAERLWRRTAAPAAPGLAHLPRPGAPNTDLRFTPYDGAAGAGVPVPVLEISPRWFGAWARLVAGSEPQPTAVATLPARPSGTAAPVRRERELPVAERVRRFLATASPDAAELAAHVAVSVPSLPVMRLIQHRVLGGSGPGQLAEVLLSGLLRPAGGVHYVFVPGAREALLDTLPRPEALHTRHVLEAVSAEIERRAGTSAETFRALLPTGGGPVALAADTDHFAVLTPETRSHLAPGSTNPDLQELLGRPVDELLADEWDRPPRPTLIGVDNVGPVSVDVLRSHPELPHGQITGPRPERDALMRTLVLSLALTHSPNVVTFNFFNFSGPMPFAGLGSIPHTTHAMHAMAVSYAAVSEMTQDLEAERQRREAVLLTAGVRTWDEYQIAVANGRPLDPLPALIVFTGDVGALLEAEPDLGPPLRDLCEKARAQGIVFVFCEPSDSPLPAFVDTVGWTLGTPSPHDEDAAFLHVFGEQARPRFRPARISVDDVFPLGDRMRMRFSERDGATPPSTVPEPDVTPITVPRFDVLRLNGGGPSGMFPEAWARPASTPRNPAIGYDPAGNVVSLYPLDASAGLPHGLIVGSPEARQRVVRAITLALAAGYSPANLSIAFAGLGEHPLGETLDLPHVRHSRDELLGHPDELQRFLDYLTHELDTRSARPPRNVPGGLRAHHHDALRRDAAPAGGGRRVADVPVQQARGGRDAPLPGSARQSPRRATPAHLVHRREHHDLGPFPAPPRVAHRGEPIASGRAWTRPRTVEPLLLRRQGRVSPRRRRFPAALHRDGGASRSRGRRFRRPRLGSLAVDLHGSHRHRGSGLRPRRAPANRAGRRGPGRARPADSRPGRDRRGRAANARGRTSRWRTGAGRAAADPAGRGRRHPQRSPRRAAPPGLSRTAHARDVHGGPAVREPAHRPRSPHAEQPDHVGVRRRVARPR